MTLFFGGEGVADGGGKSGEEAEGATGVWGGEAAEELEERGRLGGC
jgi:hypothetical protein